MPLAYCFLIFAYDEQILGLTLARYKLVVKLFMTMWTISLVGQLAQAGVLLVGILKLKQLISRSGYARMVNNFAFAIHFTIFFFYVVLMVILFITTVEMFIAVNNNSSASDLISRLLNVRLAATLVSFVFQCILFGILWRMDNVKKVETPGDITQLRTESVERLSMIPEDLHLNDNREKKARESQLRESIKPDDLNPM